MLDQPKRIIPRQRAAVRSALQDMGHKWLIAKEICRLHQFVCANSRFLFRPFLACCAKGFRVPIKAPFAPHHTSAGPGQVSEKADFSLFGSRAKSTRITGGRQMATRSVD